MAKETHPPVPNALWKLLGDLLHSLLMCALSFSLFMAELNTWRS